MAAALPAENMADAPASVMKTVIQLLFVAVLLHGLARAALVSWKYYQFKDAIEEELIFSEFTSLDRIHTRIVELAGEYEIPIEEEVIDVTREGLRTMVDAAYTEEVKLLPRIYEPVWAFDASVTVRAVR